MLPVAEHSRIVELRRGAGEAVHRVMHGADQRFGIRVRGLIWGQ